MLKHVTQRRNLHLAVDRCCVLFPTAVRVGTGAETASEEIPDPNLCSRSRMSWGLSVGVRLGFVIEGISWVQGQALIPRTKQVNKGLTISVELVSVWPAFSAVSVHRDGRSRNCPCRQTA